MGYKYTNDDLIEFFWKYYKENKEYPMSNDFRFSKNYPDLGVIRKRFGGWNNYLKEVGVIDKNSNDGWYIHDEAVLRKFYQDNKIDIIIESLMIKRKESSIREKALRMGLKVKKETYYKHKYADDEYVEIMKSKALDFYKRHGISPNQNELNFPRYAFKTNWNSYNEFLEECNLPILRREITIDSKEDGIDLLLKIKHDLNRTPTVNDLNDYGIHKNWFAKRFGSFRNALFNAGLILEEEYNVNLKIEKTINMFKELYRKTKTVPSYKEFQKFASKHKLITANTLMKSLKLYPYTKLCRELFGESNWNDLSKEELLSLLVNLKNKLKRVPMATELREYGLPSFNVYKTTFNVRYFNDIIRLLGWEPYGHDPFYRTDEELLDDYLNLYNKLDRLPYISEFREHGIADYTVYINRFKDVKNVCSILNIDYKSEELKNGAGLRCFDNNDDICKSINEMVITNILIDSNLAYVKEYPYKNILKNIENNINMDWFLIELNIGVEFFGLFNEDYLNINNWLGKYSRKTIEKIKLAKDNNFTLIDIYPSDLDNNFKGLIEKFNKHNIIIKIYNNDEVVI